MQIILGRTKGATWPKRKERIPREQRWTGKKWSIVIHASPLHSWRLLMIDNYCWWLMISNDWWQQWSWWLMVIDENDGNDASWWQRWWLWFVILIVIKIMMGDDQWRLTVIDDDFVDIHDNDFLLIGEFYHLREIQDLLVHKENLVFHPIATWG